MKAKRAESAAKGLTHEELRRRADERLAYAQAVVRRGMSGRALVKMVKNLATVQRSQIALAYHNSPFGQLMLPV